MVKGSEGEACLIHCRAVKKSYAARPVLQGIDLVVGPGVCARHLSIDLDASM